MGQAQIVNLASELVWLVLQLSLPIVAAVSIIGLLVGLLQALTQIQDQTVSFLIKLFTASIILALTYHWMGEALMNYSSRCFQMIGQLVR